MLKRMRNKGNTPPFLVGVKTWPATVEIFTAIFFRKLRIKLPQDPETPLLGIYPKDEHSYHRAFAQLCL